MIRAAAKNHELRRRRGQARELRRGARRARGERRRVSADDAHWLANEAFAQTARYDAAISRWFRPTLRGLPDHWVVAYEKVLDLSYGENPHQRAALYAEAGARTHVLSRVAKLHGKALSFNNVLDLDSARRLVDDFERAGAA